MINGQGFILGTKILEEKDSSTNNQITVKKTLGLGTYIQVQGITQSGGVVENIWKSTLKKLRTKKIKNCLILGLGGGSAAKYVRKYFTKADIIGVDIDPVIVELGKKYLGLDELNIEIKILDAYKFVRQEVKDKRREYVLILVDLYQGREVPEKFQSDEFIRIITGLLTDDGIVVFNRLYFDKKRKDAMKFAQKLEKIFPKVDYFYPEANIMFICFSKK